LGARCEGGLQDDQRTRRDAHEEGELPRVAGNEALIPADGFYEWRIGTNGKKEPLWFRVEDAAPFAFAGLWTAWHDRELGQTVESCTIITTAANELVAPVHDRMPVILDRKTERAWLDPEHDGHEAATLLLRYTAERMSVFSVSPSLNSVRNDGADLTADAEPVELLAARPSEHSDVGWRSLSRRPPGGGPRGTTRCLNDERVSPY